MERRIEIDKKINVFISSKCGVDNYDEVRIQLKTLIEDTGFAKVYLFEDRKRASTLTSEQDYSYGVDDSDVCIFLIDNGDGVTNGVMKEYQRAKAHPKKSFFIFCNENEKEHTQIQRELHGASGSKYYTIENFNDFADIGFQSLINDISEIYISYCKGRLKDSEFSNSLVSLEEINDITSELFNKKVFKNIDITKKIITTEISSRSDVKVEGTSDLDKYSSEFLKVLFGYKKINEFNTYFLTSILKDMQSENLHIVVLERWKAIQHYWMNDLDKAIEYENKSLNLARELQLPNWLIQDILIDLNNLYIFKGQEVNQYIFNSTSQKELDNEKAALFYPLLDSYEKSLLQEIINQTEKSSLRSPYTITWGSNINNYGEYISNIYIMAVYNGSLTHLLRTFNRIKNVAFSLCDQFSDWEFRVLLFKMALTKGDKKELNSLIELFNEVYGKMNFKDASSIYEFSKSNPIKHQKEIAQLLSFQYLGYFFSEDYFINVWDEILEIIIKWIDSEDRIVGVGDYIFESISENLLRLNNNLVVSNIILKVFDKGLRRFYDKVLEVIIKIDFDILSKDNIIAIMDQLELLIDEEESRKKCINLKHSIISVRLNNFELSESLNNTVMRSMPEFYEGIYCLETQIKTQLGYEEDINKFIISIRNRNKSQGLDGRYSQYSDNPYKTIENIITSKGVNIGRDLVNSIIPVCIDTLYSDKQSLSAKVQATNLISYLKLATDPELFNFNQLIEQLKNDEEFIFNIKEIMFLNKTSKATLYFNFMMMKLIFSSVELEEMVELFSSYNHADEFEKLEALKAIISIFEHIDINKIDDKIMLLLLQFELGLTNDDNHDVRFYATKALLNIISVNNKGPIIKKILSIMDFDSVFIKSLILSNSTKLECLDPKAYGFILDKALVDNHFVIRERALTLKKGAKA